MALTAGSEGSLLYWSSNFVQDAYKMNAKVGATGLVAFTIAMAVGRFIIGVVARYIPLRRIMLALIFATAAASFGLVAVHSLPVSLVCFVLSGLGIACFWPSILTVATQRIAVGSATLLAMLSMSGILGFGVLPWSVGQLADRFGLRTGLVLVPCALAVAGAALIVVFRLDLRQARADEDAAAQAEEPEGMAPPPEAMIEP
jgi:fucose permease